MHATNWKWSDNIVAKVLNFWVFVSIVRRTDINETMLCVREFVCTLDFACVVNIDHDWRKWVYNTWQALHFNDQTWETCKKNALIKYSLVRIKTRRRKKEHMSSEQRATSSDQLELCEQRPLVGFGNIMLWLIVHTIAWKHELCQWFSACESVKRRIIISALSLCTLSLEQSNRQNEFFNKISTPFRTNKMIIKQFPVALVKMSTP